MYSKFIIIFTNIQFKLVISENSKLYPIDNSVIYFLMHLITEATNCISAVIVDYAKIYSFFVTD